MDNNCAFSTTSAAIKIGSTLGKVCLLMGRGARLCQPPCSHQLFSCQSWTLHTFKAEWIDAKTKSAHQDTSSTSKTGGTLSPEIHKGKQTCLTLKLLNLQILPMDICVFCGRTVESVQSTEHPAFGENCCQCKWQD